VDVEPRSSPEWESAEQGEVDWIGLSSPSIARNLPRLLSTDALSRVKLVSISPVTSEAAREAGLTIVAEATEHTWHGILQAIISVEG
ncbi:MAG: uroporphyrinogen-III synthase, partial [Planctomycetes bacterium]|nr:uroporphyrinogen-III synthase [Planctomycetota bacterium]